MLGRALLFMAGILVWGAGRGFGLPVRWAGLVARPELAAALLWAALCLLAVAIVVFGMPGGGWRRGHGSGAGLPLSRAVIGGCYWLLAGLLWAAMWGAVGTGDAWRFAAGRESGEVGARGAALAEAEWRVRWTDVPPTGSTRPWAAVALSRNGEPVRGRLQFWPPADCAGDRWLPGDIAVLPARLTWPEGPHNPGQADARVALATAGQAGRLQVRQASWCAAEPEERQWWRPAAWSERGRRVLAAQMERYLGSDWTGFASGLLLGRSDQVPDRWREAFRESGALHLMAVSGTHLSLVVAPLWPLVRRRHWWWLPLVAGLAYVWLSGASPSAMRAGMQLLLTLALRRQLHGNRHPAVLSPRERLQPWAMAALLTVIWDPLALFRPALQLSLTASAGICLWAGRWQATLLSWWGGGTVAAYAAEGLAVGLAAQTAVLPLSFWLFGGFAPAGFISSLALVPVTALTLHLLLIGLPLALAVPALGAVALAGPALLLRALAGLALAIANMPLGFVWWPAGAAAALALFAVLGAGSGLWPWPGRHMTATLTVSVLAFRLWLPVLLPESFAPVGPGPGLGIGRSVTVTFLDVGQGDAIVIRAPDGSVTVVDGGGSLEWGDSAGGGGPDPGRTVLVPYVRWARIGVVDRIIVSHAHADHVGGLATVLREVPVREVIEPGDPVTLGGEATGPAYARFRDAIAAAGVSRRVVAFGERLDLGGGLTATVLGPPEPPLYGTRSDLNSNSLVLLLQYGRWRALLAGDMEAPAEDWLIGRGLDLDVHVLKVAHHGSNYSTQPAWLAATNPSVAVVSAGRYNPFGHPGADTLARLAAAGACTLRTDVGGAVTIETDGREWQARTFHGGTRCESVPRLLPLPALPSPGLPPAGLPPG